jgi:hypothetical protein
MARDVNITSIGLFTQMNACAHSCRYCCMADKKLVAIPLARFVRLIERFADWRDRTRPGFRVAVANQYSSEEETEALGINRHLSIRLGDDLGRMHLGGLKMRSESEMRAWLQTRYDLGTRFANASYAGIFDTHDSWNRRRGDFQHLLSLQTIAAEIGMELGQYLFVACSTFPQLEILLDHLEALPKQAKERFLVPFGYIGWARDLESDRITEEHREALSARLRRLLRPAQIWRSEREWIDAEGDNSVQEDFMLRLDVDETNIELLESMSCQNIFDDLAARTLAAYSTLPSWDELRDSSGDRSNRRIYANRSDIERKWLDAYLEKYSMAIERKLTHLTSSF